MSKDRIIVDESRDSVMTEREKAIRYRILDRHDETLGSDDACFLLSQLDVQRQSLERWRQALKCYGLHRYTCHKLAHSVAIGKFATATREKQVEVAVRQLQKVERQMQQAPFACTCGFDAALQVPSTPAKQR